MLNDIQDSIKAKLYDFTYTPFMSSILISWIILNHTYLLIYFSDFELDKKLPILKEHDFAYHCCGYYLHCAFNIIFPILFGLFYVYVYPQISKKFYEYTLNRTKELKVIKQSIVDETPMTLAEGRDLRKLASILEEEKDKALRNLSKKDAEWQGKLDNELGLLNGKLVGLNSDIVAADIKITDLETERDTLQKDCEDIQAELTQSNQFLETKNDECEQLKIEIEQLRKKVPVIKQLIEYDPNVVDDDIKTSNNYEVVMTYLHDKFDPTSEAHLIESITKDTKLGKTLVRHIINTLIDDKILYNEPHTGMIKMTKDGAIKVLQYVADHPSIPF